MSHRNGFILAFGLLALGAASAQAQDDRYRKTDPYYGDDRYGDDRGDDRMYKEGIYQDDDFWYGDDARVRSRTMNNRFRGMDRNRDGVISRSEWRGNDRSFENQDWNRDGVLSGREVRRNARRNRTGRAEAVDYNRNGVIERGEWMGSRSEFNRLDRNRNGRAEAIDRNRNGVIERGEWMGSRSEFNRLDRNRDGYITSAEARLRYY